MPNAVILEAMDWNQCCRCETARTDRPRLHPARLTFDYCDSEPHKRNPLLRPIGVEIEVVGFKNPSKEALVNLYNTCVRWNAPIGTDGSLHSESSVEIRTSPASGKAFALQVWEITRAIRAAGGFVNRACGLHVHVDMRNYMPERYSMVVPHGLDCLVEMWALCEKEFYEIVAPERRTGTYSQPWGQRGYGWYQSAATETALREAKYGVMKYHTIKDVDRYSGCNLHAIQKHKTIEYRLHQGTVNTRVITAWALLCAAFTVQATESKAPAELWKFVKEIGPLRYLQWLAPTRDARRYVTLARRKRPVAEVVNEVTEEIRTAAQAAQATRDMQSAMSERALHERELALARAHRVRRRAA